MLADVLDVGRTAGDRWYVTNGATAIGPVNLELLARGIEAGRVPVESFIRHEGWKVWRPLSELAVVTNEAPAQVTPEPRPEVEPPPPSTDDITQPARAAMRGEITAADALAGASDLAEALLLLLSAAVQRTESDAAIIHEVRDDAAVAVCAHGPAMFDVLGEKARLLDAAMVAAAGGNLVVAEPTAGPAGLAVLARLEKLGVVAEGAAMFPIRPHGRLHSVLEVGRAKPYKARELAELEELVEAMERETTQVFAIA
jgi:hypothetical protein